jgi:DNA repair photolyase
MTELFTYTTIYRVLHGFDPPTGITWESSDADILSPGRGFMGAFDFTMQLQVGCPGGCLFCYVPTRARLTPPAVRGKNGQTWGFRVCNKRDVIQKLTKHLHRGTLADKTVYWSGITDPYAAPPKLTQAIWTTLIDTPAQLRPRRIAVQTRFRPDRDAVFMQAYANTTHLSDGGPPVLVSYSVGTDRNDLIAAWERATPRFEHQLQAIRTLREADIFTVATLSPLSLWRDLKGTLTQFKAWGVAYLTCLFLKDHVGPSDTPALFLAYIRDRYPVLLDPRWQAQQVQVMHEIFGAERVLIGKLGFDSLACPQRVYGSKKQCGSRHECWFCQNGKEDK